MNILFVINSIEPGGAEVFLLRFARALKEKGYGVFVLPIRSEQTNNDFLHLFKEAEISILEPYREPVKWKQNLFWKMNALCSKAGIEGIYVRLKKWDEKKFYQRTVKQCHIQVINSHLFDSDYFSVKCLKQYTGLPVVVTMHSSYNKVAIEKSVNSQRFISLAAEILQGANFITYLTADNLYIYDHFPYSVLTPKKQIYLGYDKPNVRSRKDEAKENKFTFGMVARGIKEKGWEEAIEAFLLVQEKYPDCELVLICPKTEYILNLEKNYLTNSSIQFIGYSPNPEEKLQFFDLSLLPSYYPESLPITIIESLSFGVPVLASDVGETKNMLLSESNELAGKIFGFNEDGKVNVDELAISMINYIEDKVLLSEHKKLALSAAQKFSMEKCAVNYISIFSDLTNNLHG